MAQYIDVSKEALSQELLNILKSARSERDSLLKKDSGVVPVRQMNAFNTAFAVDRLFGREDDLFYYLVQDNYAAPPETWEDKIKESVDHLKEVRVSADHLAKEIQRTAELSRYSDILRDSSGLLTSIFDRSMDEIEQLTAELSQDSYDGPEP